MLPKEEHEDLFYHIALTMVPGVGAKLGRQILEHFGNATNIFKAPIKELKQAEGIGEAKAKNFKDASLLEKAEKELQFVINNQITTYQINKTYPKRLLNCIDAPLLLFYKGQADLESTKTIAVVGTRKHTDYGTQLCEDLIEALQNVSNVVVLSGLALGIDAIAHKKSVQHGIPTVGVLGHGFDRIYPTTNRLLAKSMLERGGLLTEFPSGTELDRGNFPMRNRIVAGLSDVTVVIESSISGGALITAKMASGYNREVAAFPGRVSDSRSAGCNELIRTNTAAMITNAQDLLDLMNWNEKQKKKPVQKQLFITLNPEEEKIINLLNQKDQVHADELYHHVGITNSLLAATLLQLEMQGLIRALPGKYYRISN